MDSAFFVVFVAPGSFVSPYVPSAPRLNSLWPHFLPVRTFALPSRVSLFPRVKVNPAKALLSHFGLLSCAGAGWDLSNPQDVPIRTSTVTRANEKKRVSINPAVVIAFTLVPFYSV